MSPCIFGKSAECSSAATIPSSSISLSAQAGGAVAPSCRNDGLAQLVGPVDQPVAVVAVEEKSAVVVEGSAGGGVAVSGCRHLVEAAQQQQLSQAPVPVRPLHSQPVFEAVVLGIRVPRVVAAAGNFAFSNRFAVPLRLDVAAGTPASFPGKADRRVAKSSPLSKTSLAISMI